MSKKESNKIDLSELYEFLRLIEVQREFAYHLEKYKEAVENKRKEMEILTIKAQRLAQMETRFRAVESKLKKNLDEEQIKEINKLLRNRFMKVRL